MEVEYHMKMHLKILQAFVVLINVLHHFNRVCWAIKEQVSSDSFKELNSYDVLLLNCV